MKARLIFIILSVLAMALSPIDTLAQTKVIQGNSRYGKILYNWDGRYIRQGESKYGDILYNFDGTNLRAGQSQYSTVLLNISGILPSAILIMLVV